MIKKLPGLIQNCQPTDMARLYQRSSAGASWAKPAVSGMQASDWAQRMDDPARR